MRFVLLAVFVCICGSVTTRAQSCLTPDDIKKLTTGLASPTPATLNKKLQAELIKIAQKQHFLLQEIVSEDQKKNSDREKLHKLYEDGTAKLCDLIKANGWPTSASVGSDGVGATYYILKN